MRPSHEPDSVDQVLFIPINYNTEKQTLQLVESLAQQSCPSWNCLIVHNGGSSGSLEGGAFDEQFQLIKPARNVGYFGGARFAVDHWLGHHNRLPRWTVVCNADIRFNRLFVAGLRRATADVLAPAIIASDGVDQNPYMISRPRFHKTALRCMVLATPFVDGVARKVILSHPRPRGNIRVAGEIYAPYGAAIVFNRSYFDKGGSLEHPGFLFGEEITIGERCQAIGAAVRYEPSLRAFHEEHTSTGGAERSRQLLRMQRSSVRDSTRSLLMPPRS